VKRAALLLCLVLAASACSGDDEVDAAPTTTAATTTTSTSTSTTTTSTTSTTTSTTSTTAAPEEPRWLLDEFPELDLTVEDPTVITDFEKLIDEYFVWRSWLAAHPIDDGADLDAALRAMLCPESPNYPDGSPFNEQLLDDNERWEIPPSEQALTAFHPAYEVQQDNVWVVYRERVNAEIVVRDLATGDVLRTMNSDGGPWTSVDQEWRLRGDGTWCVWDTRAPNA
jgi:hypothetical protein